MIRAIAASIVARWCSVEEGGVRFSLHTHAGTSTQESVLAAATTASVITAAR